VLLSLNETVTAEKQLAFVELEDLRGKKCSLEKNCALLEAKIQVTTAICILQFL
jgi:hypothetical protein